MNDYPWRIQIIYGALLGLILFWFFLPIAIGWKLLASLIIIAIASALFYHQLKYRRLLNASTNNIEFLSEKLALLPARQRYRLPIFLVTGNCAKEFFPSDLSIAEQNIIVSSEAVWIYVEEYSELPIAFDSLIARWPDMLGRVGLFLAVTPELESKSGLFTAKLQAFRQSWVDTCRVAKYQLPVYVSTHLGLNNLHYHDNATVPVYWYRIIDRKLSLLDEYSSPIDNWVNDKVINSVERQQRIAIRAMLVEYEKWINTNILEVFLDPKQPIAKCIPTGTVIYPINNHQLDDNLIERKFTDITTLHLPNDPSLEQVITPPDRLVKFMPIAYPFSPIYKIVCNMIMITALFLMAAMAGSYWNNIKLVELIRNDIKVYNLIAMDSYAEKREVLAVIKRDRDLLNSYFNQGEPTKLGLGLYHGQKLLDPLNQLIGQYQPEPPPPEPPVIYVDRPVQTVFKPLEAINLNSLSLFESGKSDLRPESTKVLIDMLLEMKAQAKKVQDQFKTPNQNQEAKKIGFLIKIDGYTDSTGDPNKNQQLSLDRAEAVRVWLIQATNISENCFAIQGYGAKNLLASDDTPEGRAQNRRVEITLVPQISTCQLVDEN